MGPDEGGRVGASATQHVVQNLVRDTTRDEDVRIILLSVFASAFSVALGYPGVLVHRRSPGLAYPWNARVRASALVQTVFDYSG